MPYIKPDGNLVWTHRYIFTGRCRFSIWALILKAITPCKNIAVWPRESNQMGLNNGESMLKDMSARNTISGQYDID